jgi:DNA-binding IclR family transcriptional regulator
VEFKIADLINACPGIPRPTINRVLTGLQTEGYVECSGRGRAAVWRKLKGQGVLGGILPTACR